LPRFGVDTSNIIESLNGTWSEIRNLQPLKLIDAIYTAVMKTFYDRYHRVMKDLVLPDATLKLFQERYQYSRRYKVFQSGNNIYQVEVPDTGVKHVVNLQRRECDCTNFQYYQSPCVHAIAACRWAEKDLYKFFWTYYKLRVYRDIYSVFLIPFSSQDLPLSEHIHPPVLRRQRGQPKTKRYRKGEQKRRPKKCGTCGEKGHDKRTCRNQPATNGRRQRAHDRVLSSSSNSGEDLQQNATVEEIDSIDEDLQAQVEQDLQFRVEMQLSEQRMAQHDAWWSNELVKAAERAAAVGLLSQRPVDSSGEEDGGEDASSSLSRVSSSRYEGLEDEWWKAKGDSEVINGGGSEVAQRGDSKVVTVRLRSQKRKRVQSK
jgi:hypothetical protein